MTVDDVVGRVGEYGCDVVEITGGEPLLQKDVYPLMERLLDDGRTVLLETGGHLQRRRRCRTRVDPRHRRQVSRAAARRTRCTGPTSIGCAPTDEVKFVIEDRADYEYARDVVARHDLSGALRGGAVLAGARRARSAASSPNGSSPTGCRPAAAAGAQVHLGSRETREASCDRARLSIEMNAGGPAPERRPRFVHGGRDRAARTATSCTRSTVRYGQVPRARDRGGAERRRGARRRAAPRAGRALSRRSAAPRSSATARAEGSRARRDASIPSTYVPARNTVFLSLALAWAEVLGAERSSSASTRSTTPGYPDCRPEYLARVRAAGARWRRRPASKGGRFAILAPLIAADEGGDHPPRPRARRRLRPDPQLLRSRCRTARPCGRCDSCVLRARGFARPASMDPATRHGVAT